MKIRFWGTRGSIAKAGPTTVRYGGNTSCVEIRSAANDVVILDGGTGIHGLAQHILRESTLPRSASIFISHTHWDHIQGLPFFAPFFLPNHKWDIFGPAGVQQNLAEILRGQMSKAYFPITMQEFNAEIQHHDLTEGHLQIGDISITTQYLNHPGVTMGYRIVVDGVTVVYSTDHEPHARRLAAGGIPDKGSEDERHGRFLADADFVIHDAQYTAAEYDKRVGWGHSTMEYVVDLAARASVEHLVLFHHDPNRTDAEIDQLVTQARARLGDRAGKTEVTAAAEGRDLEKVRPYRFPWAPPPTESVRFKEKTDDSADLDFDEPPPSSALGKRKHAVPVLLYAPSFPMLEQAVNEARQTALVATNLDLARDLFRVHAPPIVVVEADHVEQFLERWGAISNGSGPDTPGQLGSPMKILVGHREPPAGAIEGAGIHTVLNAPFSLIYAVSRVLIWTNQTTRTWNRADHLNEETERLVCVSRIKQTLQNPKNAREVRQHVDIAQSLLWNVEQRDLTLAFNIIGDCWQETIARNRPSETASEEALAEKIHRDVSFCAHVVARRKPLDVENALNSEEFRWHPHVVGGFRVRSYFGVNVDVLGQTVGSLCAFSSHGFQLSDGQRQGLRQVASLLASRLEQMILLPDFQPNPH